MNHVTYNIEHRLKNFLIRKFGFIFFTIVRVTSYELRERGSVLIMSLIITSGILVIGIEISTYVASSIRQARNSDRALIARYAAESAIESGLYQLRKEQRTTLRKDAGSIGSATWTFVEDPANIADVKFSDTIPSFSKPLFAKESVTQFALYSQTNEGTAAIGGLQTMRVTWQGIDQSCAQAEQPPGIETSILAWNDKAIDWSSAGILKNFQQADSTSTMSVDVDFDSLTPGCTKASDPPTCLSDKPIVVRVKPYFCDLFQVAISLPKPNRPGETIPIPNYFFLKPFGTAAQVQQDVLQAIVPGQGSISDIFDFALFSEEQIRKAE